MKSTFLEKEYDVEPVFEDSFENMDNWLKESPGTASAADGILEWNCLDSFGTIWCTRRFEGNTVVEYEVESYGGADNINFLYYAVNEPDGLLETTDTRTGEYGEYHKLPNYIVTYLRNNEPRWRIRFRKCPGFNLLSETYVDLPAEPGIRHKVTTVFEPDGTIRFGRNEKLLHSHIDTGDLYRSGYHGFRSFKSHLKYRNFKVYRIDAKS